MRSTAIALVAILCIAGCSAAAFENSNIAVMRSLLSLAGNRQRDPNALDREVLHVDTVPLPPERAWLELARVWNQLRLPVTGVDEAGRRIGGSTVPLEQIGGNKPSAWLDCGRGIAEIYADQYQVAFSMAARVQPIEGGSTIESIIRATARPRDVSTEPFKCTSLGTLELRLAELIRGGTGTR